MLEVGFHGVRGSTPCSCAENRRYGGNTASVSLRVSGEDPILLDIGTGLRMFGLGEPHDGTFSATALVTHYHWDHILGLPFCTPLLVPGSKMTLVGPPPDGGGSVASVFDEYLRRPFFPVTVHDLPCQLSFQEGDDGVMQVGSAKVTSLVVPHTGRTFGFRVEWAGASIAYIPDHQQPIDGSYTVDENVLRLADGVDLLMHDAQYTVAEFDRKRTWGHSTYEYALWVAKEAGAKELSLFHHDPGRDDDALDEVLRCAQEWGAKHDLPVSAAGEGQKRVFGL